MRFCTLEYVFITVDAPECNGLKKQSLKNSPLATTQNVCHGCFKHLIVLCADTECHPIKKFANCCSAEISVSNIYWLTLKKGEGRGNQSWALRKLKLVCATAPIIMI